MTDLDTARPRQRILQAAKRLTEAAAQRRTIAPLTKDMEDLTLTEAYAIQAEIVQQRLARGEQLIGMKLGLTSEAKQKQMGVQSPITAWLTDTMQLPPGATLPREKLIHPRVEPEIVFIIGRRLVGPDVTADDVLQAVSAVRAGLEILDSRYTDFRFTLPDVIADNASAAYFILGDVEVPPSAVNLAQEECVVEVEGQVVASATGAAVQGHPAEAVARAVNALAGHGVALEAGWIVLTGGLTAALPIPPRSTVTVRFTHLGTVTINGGE